MPLIAAASDENDEIRELTKPVVEALIDGGFFTMLKTRSVGAMELKPSIFAQVTEALAQADGSTGWVVCQSNGCSTTSAWRVAGEYFPALDRPSLTNVIEGKARGAGKGFPTPDGYIAAIAPAQAKQIAVSSRPSHGRGARSAPDDQRVSTMWVASSVGTASVTR